MSAPTIVPSHGVPLSQMPPISLSTHANQDSCTTSPSESPPSAPVSKTNESIDVLESSIALLPKDFPVAAPSDILAAFSGDPALYNDPTIVSADLWEEILNQKMHIFLGKSDLELVPLVCVGENETSRFCRFVCYFVGQCSIDPMLFDSRVLVIHYQDSLAKDKPSRLIGAGESEEQTPWLQSPNDDAMRSSASSSQQLPVPTNEVINVDTIMEPFT
ncbi:hypothetical protein EV421DRAFT_1903979 [Armillaria borealis]|uniref:Uncharacterized protein n=1 Tax=Armillaria borealis TaxID=47425 RepID=A0AA39JGW4_9AGAR|nr:hypothetical protein EV421DRAFT_1903979 [Armillaria borealis]